MSFIRSALVAVAVTSLPVLASAASIDFDAAGYELATDADRSIEIINDGFGGSGASVTLIDGLPIELFAFDLTTFSVFSSFDVTSSAEYALTFDADGTLTDTANGSTGADVSLMNGALEVLFEDFSGTGVFAGVDALLVTFTSANLELDAFGGYIDFTDDQGDTSTLRVQGLNSVSAIPLPAGLPLMLGGLACFAWVRRRNTA